MKRYDSYKDSGVEWIGDLPSNWQIKRIKHTTYVKGRIGWQGMRSDEFLESSDSYVVTGTDFEKGLVKWDTCYQVPLERYEEDPFIQLREGDLLITKDGTIGKIAVVKNIPKIATLNSGVFLTRPLSDSYVPEFMYWILYSEVFKSFYDYNKSGSTIQHLYQNVFNEFKFPLPTIKEQTAIANYLDQKTTQIDDLIAKKERLIQLLEEERTAIINQAVTKGLDPTVPMKDSGIEWLGEIPAHWGVKRMNFISTKIGDGLHGTPNYVEVSVFPFINGNNIGEGEIIITDRTKFVSEEEYKRNQKTFTPNTLLMSINGTIGNLAYYNGESIMLGKSVAYINLESNVNKEFIYYYLKSEIAKDYINMELSGSTIKNLSLYSINKTPIPNPAKLEQIEIVNFIKTKLLEIEKIISKTQQEIELLKEYKTALISEVVTGKVDVREEKLN